MITEKVGRVSENEKNKILILHERILAIEELEISIEDNELDNEYKEILINKVVKEKIKTNNEFNQWWDRTAEKYKWIGDKDGHWSIDFFNNDIYLVIN